jgi:hypothetical protein
MSIVEQNSPDLWQSIEAAPDDMRCILVFVPGNRIGDFEEESDMIHVAFRKRPGTYCLQDEDHFIVEPSHWMPLPANPMKYRPKARS